MMTPTYAFLNGMLNGAGSDSVPTVDGLKNSWDILIRQPFTPGVTLTLASITVANFNGYLPIQQPTWSNPYNSSSGLQQIEGALASFRASDSVTPNTIYGHGIMSADSTTLLLTEAFNPAIQVSDSTTLIGIIPILGLDPDGNFGTSVISS